MNGIEVITLACRAAFTRDYVSSKFKMRRRDGEVVGERGVFTHVGDSTVCGAAAAVAAAKVETKVTAM